MKKKFIAGILILLGLACLSVPFFYHFLGKYKSDGLIKEAETMIVQGRDDEEAQKNAKTILNKEDAAMLGEKNVIGLIEIEVLSLKYAVLEGADSSQLAYGIGHISDTAGIGEMGNCVLAGHRGSRCGAYFKYLNHLKRGDVVKATDKKGNVFLYEVQSWEVVHPYDNTVKNQGAGKQLTLLTCENSGTMRLIYHCNLVSEQEN